MQIFQNPNFYLNTMHLHKQLANTTVASLSSARLKAYSFPKERQKNSPILVLLQPRDSRRIKDPVRGRKTQHSPVNTDRESGWTLASVPRRVWGHFTPRLSSTALVGRRTGDTEENRQQVRR